jgi:hypothetical protein
MAQFSEEERCKLVKCTAKLKGLAETLAGLLVVVPEALGSDLEKENDALDRAIQALEEVIPA